MNFESKEGLSGLTGGNVGVGEGGEMGLLTEDEEEVVAVEDGDEEDES